MESIEARRYLDPAANANDRHALSQQNGSLQPDFGSQDANRLAAARSNSNSQRRLRFQESPAQKITKSVSRIAGVTASANSLQLAVVETRDKRARQETGSDEELEGEGSDSLEDGETAASIAERRAAGKRGRKRAAPSAHTRTVRLDKYGPAGPFVYESLQTYVCAELVRTRSFYCLIC
jgi:hypothetical protein